MTQSQFFGSGLELAPFLTSSGILQKSWDVIVSSALVSNFGEGFSWKVYKEPNSDLTIVAFEAKIDASKIEKELVLSSELKQNNFLHFEFLCTPKNPTFSVNKTAVQLFCQNVQKLDQLKSEVNSSSQLIVTGNGVGGQIASLFTLSLLDSIGSGKKRPLCITFGSPLVGDKKLQEAVSRSSTWSSCFLHVVSYKDPLPKELNPHTNSHVPFGTFLFCSDTHSTSFESPESVSELLAASVLVQDQGFQSRDYGKIVETLYHRAVYKDVTLRSEDLTPSTSLHASIILQLGALGLTPHSQQQNIVSFNKLVKDMEKLEMKSIIQKREKFDPSKKLNTVKIDMAQLEWYKKDSKNRNMGYYDSFKKMYSRCDQDVVNFQRNLTNYWEDVVKEAEMKPQKEGAAFRTRWLYAGTNYRRMVEPLDIAQYYVNGGRDYVNKARSKHYKQLEEWLKEGKAEKKDSSKNTTRNNVEAILTIDSCFWAHVEEALLSYNQLKDAKSDAEKEEATKKLFEFEDYVYGLLKNYEVSPEIFLKESSYMSWWNQWNQYNEIVGTTHNAALASFMSNPYYYYEQYTAGDYDFH